MARFWVSWTEPGYDSRPAREWDKAPTWWETGVGDNYVTICAVVDAEDRNRAETIVRRFWDPIEWRFCEERPDGWMPSPGPLSTEEVMTDNPRCPTCQHHNALLTVWDPDHGQILFCRDCGHRLQWARFSLEAPGGPLRVYGADEDDLLCFWYSPREADVEGFQGKTGYVVFDEDGSESNLEPLSVVSGYLLPSMEVAESALERLDAEEMS